LSAVFIHFTVYYNYAGGVLLALIEGVGILITRWSADQFKMGMWSLNLVHTLSVLVIIVRVTSGSCQKWVAKDTAFCNK